MSLKPPKKTDFGKSWMKPRLDHPKKIQPEYHLIVSEGTETEPAYFSRIKEIINSQYRGRIQLDVFGEGDNTLNLFDKAKEKAMNGANVYKHVWVVYDTDDFPPTHIDNTAQLCETCSNEETKYHAIWSNQCFELWYLQPFMEVAITNGKRLDSYNAGKKPSVSAPGTKMHILIEKLKPYLS